MSEKFHGTCLCGQVTFDVQEPETLSLCHCTRCQRWSGGAFSASVEVEDANFRVTAGEKLIKHFTEEGFTGVGFCTNCGSSLYAFGDGKYYVSAGTLPGLKLQPEYHMMVAYKAPGTGSAATRRSTRSSRPTTSHTSSSSGPGAVYVSEHGKRATSDESGEP